MTADERKQSGSHRRLLSHSGSLQLCYGSAQVGAVHPNRPGRLRSIALPEGLWHAEWY